MHPDSFASGPEDEPRYSLGRLRDFTKDWQHLDRSDFSISELAVYVGGERAAAPIAAAAAALQAKLDRLRGDFERPERWAHANSSGSPFAIQILYFAKARLEEWDLPVEKWEP